MTYNIERSEKIGNEPIVAALRALDKFEVAVGGDSRIGGYAAVPALPGPDTPLLTTSSADASPIKGLPASDGQVVVGSPTTPTTAGLMASQSPVDWRLKAATSPGDADVQEEVINYRVRTPVKHLVPDALCEAPAVGNWVIAKVTLRVPLPVLGLDFSQGALETRPVRDREQHAAGPEVREGGGVGAGVRHQTGSHAEGAAERGGAVRGRRAGGPHRGAHPDRHLHAAGAVQVQLLPTKSEENHNPGSRLFRHAEFHPVHTQDAVFSLRNSSCLSHHQQPENRPQSMRCDRELKQ